MSRIRRFMERLQSVHPEHIIVDRVVPLLLVVVLPLLGAVYVLQERNADARRAAQVEACERGNVIRETQTATIRYLLEVNAAAGELSTDPILRAFFQAEEPELRRLLNAAKPIDCETTVG